MKYSLDQILDEVCAYYRVKKSQIIGRDRRARINTPRQIYMFMARMYTDQPFRAIGETVSRDHATALHAWRKLSGYMLAEEREAVEEIFNQMQNKPKEPWFGYACTMGLALKLSQNFDFITELNNLNQ